VTAAGQPFSSFTRRSGFCSDVVLCHSLARRHLRTHGRRRVSASTLISVPSFFSAIAVAHSGASIEGARQAPVTVHTAAEPWRYALSFRRAGDLPDAYALAVRVRIVVTKGTVGVGWLDAGKKQFVDEVPVAAGAEASVDLLATPPFDLGPLMIRNWSSAESSTAIVLGIECFSIEADTEAEADSDVAREPPLSRPRVVPEWSLYYSSRGRGLRERARVRRFESLAEPTTLTWSDRLSVRILPGEQFSRAVYVSGTYEPNTLSVLQSLLRPGAVCLDVGANAGIVALAASRWVQPEGRVFAFEPSSREFARLCDSIERSHAANVTPIRAALSSFRGRASLRVATASAGGLNTLGDAFPYEGVDILEIERVDVMTLDDFVAQHAISAVSVIKLDVEGSEGDALSGAMRLLARDRPALIVEVFARTLQSTGWTVPRLEKLILDAGYVIFDIDDKTAELRPVISLSGFDEQNVVALPVERHREILDRLGCG
jgi:FkbM family methyltransferase